MKLKLWTTEYADSFSLMAEKNAQLGSDNFTLEAGNAEFGNFSVF